MMGRCRATILLAAICGSLAVGSAAAENVPLPTPAPLPKSGAAQPVPPAGIPSQSGPAAPAPSSQSHGYFPFSWPFDKSKQPEPATAFSAKQRELLDRVSHYLSSLQTLVGNFVQIAPDGSRTEGTFYIQKPGKVRFEYSAPSPIEVIADGSAVAVRNRDLNTQDVWPLSQTPLRYLLADHIDLLRDTDVLSISSDDKYISVVIEETQAVAGTSRLMIMFDAKDLTLRQWTVTDPQGLDTTVSIYNLNAKTKPDPDLFVINYQHAPTIGNE
ncbi:MAG: outer membrane lipoprotein carrier protein LolA [Xanthobacteraceae bacterium]